MEPANPEGADRRDPDAGAASPGTPEGYDDTGARQAADGIPLAGAQVSARLVAAERAISELRMLLAALVRDRGGAVDIASDMLSVRHGAALRIGRGTDIHRLRLHTGVDDVDPVRIGEMRTPAEDTSQQTRAALQQRIVEILAAHAAGDDSPGDGRQ